jgi:hypothetical protein
MKNNRFLFIINSWLMKKIRYNNYALFF